MPFDYFCMVRIDEKFDTLGLTFNTMTYAFH